MFARVRLILKGMTLDEVRRVIEREEGALRAKGVSAVYVFGSVARGEAGPESDVDVMIDIESGRRFSILDLVSLQEDLAHRLGVATDVHTRGGLHYWIRDQVLEGAVRVL